MNKTVDGQKKCQKCKKVFPLSSFCNNKAKKDGKSDSCKACERIRCRERFTRNVAKDPKLFIRMLWHSSKRSAPKRGLEFSITLQELLTIYDSQFGLCAVSGEKMTNIRNGGSIDTNISIDRIDSSKGYVTGNVQLVCFVVNLMKHNFSNGKLAWWANRISVRQASIDRPDWDKYFMRFAYDASTRSEDKKTKVGAVLVSSDNKIISTGYNGFPAKYDTSTINWSDRDFVRSSIIHAEMNCLLHAESLFPNSKLYVTVSPCIHCLKMVAAAGVKTVIYHEPYADCQDVLVLAKEFGIEMRQVKYD